MTDQKIDTAAIWNEVRQNNAKLRACPRHRFTGDKIVLGAKYRCLACGGTMGLTDIGYYIAGYEAAAGKADDVWPGWRR